DLECHRCRRSIGALGGQFDGGASGARPDRRGGQLGADSSRGWRRHGCNHLLSDRRPRDTRGARRRCAFAVYDLPPQKNPVQQFTSDYARPVGFFMPYGSEVDYFTGYEQDGEPQRLGCSFVVDASMSPETVLSVASDGTTVGAAAQSFGYNSV